MDSVITAKKLIGGYPSNITWQDTDFSINRGEFVAVLGPNGAGKTTLFKLILGLIKPIGGSLTVFGENPKKGNQRIGYVPQRHPIDSEIKIKTIELVKLGLDGNKFGICFKKKNIEKEAMSALKIVGAENLANKPLGELSGGELQRIFLAEALISKPELLLLDEPLANLDMKRVSEFVKLIYRIAHFQNVTVLLIAHDVNPLISVLDKIIYTANNKIVTGKPSEILTSESLTKIYDLPIEVLKDSQGRVAIIGTEQPVHQHENE
jgi:zinc/manganese transport system ATP-binding protein